MEYLAIIEKAEDSSYSAHVPDLPGCVACGDSVQEARELIEQAVGLHIESLRRHGEEVPDPTSLAMVVSAA